MAGCRYGDDPPHQAGPTKLEFLTGRPGPAGSGLDDPAGEVGNELMVVTDDATEEGTAYFAPSTARGVVAVGR